MTCHMRQSHKAAKVHAGVSGNKPKETPKLKSKVWFTPLDLTHKPSSPQPILLFPSSPLPPQLGHVLCFPSSCQILLPLLSNTELVQSWHGRVWRRQGGPGRIYADTGQPIPQRKCKKHYFPWLPCSDKNWGEVLPFLSLSFL